jgi:hypothetical protein
VTPAAAGPQQLARCLLQVVTIVTQHNAVINNVVNSTLVKSAAHVLANGTWVEG